MGVVMRQSLYVMGHEHPKEIMASINVSFSDATEKYKKYGECKMELRPLYKLDGEEYRKNKVREVWKRNGLATLGFCLIAGVTTAGMMLVAVSRSRMIFAGVFYGGAFVIGAGAYIFFLVCALKNVRNKKYDAVYEGMAQVIVAYPLMVQYLKPDGSRGVSQMDLEDQRAILAGWFIKIVVEDEEVVEIKGALAM